MFFAEKRVKIETLTLNTVRVPAYLLSTNLSWVLAAYFKVKKIIILVLAALAH